MSRIYFHSPSGEAELRGSERAWMGNLINDIALGVLDPDGNNADQLMKLVVPGHYLHSTRREGYGWVSGWRETFGNGLSVLDLRRGDWERRLDEAFEVESETVKRG